jgi:hypothetical protein
LQKLCKYWQIEQDESEDGFENSEDERQKEIEITNLDVETIKLQNVLKMS